MNKKYVFEVVKLVGFLTRLTTGNWIAIACVFFLDKRNVIFKKNYWIFLLTTMLKRSSFVLVGVRNATWKRTFIQAFSWEKIEGTSKLYILKNCLSWNDWDLRSTLEKKVLGVRNDQHFARFHFLFSGISHPLCIISRIISIIFSFW